MRGEQVGLQLKIINLMSQRELHIRHISTAKIKQEERLAGKTQTKPNLILVRQYTDWWKM